MHSTPVFSTRLLQIKIHKTIVVVVSREHFFTVRNRAISPLWLLLFVGFVRAAFADKFPGFNLKKNPICVITKSGYLDTHRSTWHSHRVCRCIRCWISAWAISLAVPFWRLGWLIGAEWQPLWFLQKSLKLLKKLYYSRWTFSHFYFLPQLQRSYFYDFCFILQIVSFPYTFVSFPLPLFIFFGFGNGKHLQPRPFWRTVI